MTKPKVLDVGNCGPDHGQLKRMLQSVFSAEVYQTDAAADTLSAMRKQPFDLVLINRKLDCDYSDGIEILKLIKQDAELAPTPVMLITNYADHQAAAVELGALPGFGKLELHTPTTRERLTAVLDPSARAASPGQSPASSQAH